MEEWQASERREALEKAKQEAREDIAEELEQQ